jgi:type IV pilus assembly protein PilY1
LVTATNAAASPQLDAQNNPINLGCFADLSINGERITGRPTIIHDKINFDSIKPNTDVCEGGVDSINMTLRYENCAMPTERIYDTNNDGIVDGTDTIVAGISTGSNLSGVTFVKSGDGTYLYIAPQLPGAVIKGGVSFGGTGVRGRIIWREIVQ